METKRGSASQGQVQPGPAAPALANAKGQLAAKRSRESVESNASIVTRKEAVRVVSTEKSEHSEEPPGGLSLLLGLYRFNQRITLHARFIVSSLTGGESRGSKSRWTPGLLERSLYNGEHHDKGSSDILNIQELFHGAETTRDLTVQQHFVCRFHLSTLARRIELVRLLCVVCTCITAPLSFILSGDWNSPELVPGGRLLLGFDCAMDVIFAICLALRFRISFLHPITKKEVTDVLKIRHYYTNSVVWWLQLISAFSYCWLGFGATLLLNNLKLVRVGPLLRAPDALWRMEDKPVVRLGRPVVLLVLGAHWTACLLFTLGGFREELIERAHDYATTFSLGYGISGEVSGGVSLYFMAFVEALYMLTGALDNPLGDGGPRDKDFGSLLMVSIFGPVGCVVVALFISAIMREQQRALALDSKHEENKAFMERALQILEIPPELQQRVLSMHLFQKFEHDVEALNSLFEKKNLSKALENTLLVYLYRETVVCSPYFRNKDPNYIIAVVNVLEDQVFLPGDYVARKGEVATSMYFVSRGDLTILIPDHEDENNVLKAKEIKKMGVGEQFGEIALVKDTVRTAWVRANTYVIVSALPSSSIRHVWVFYPKEREELLRTVEQHAERDRKRKVKQRWEKGLGAATVTPWKIKGGPGSTASFASGTPPSPTAQDSRLKSGKTVKFSGLDQREETESRSESESPKSAQSRAEPESPVFHFGEEVVTRRLQAMENRMDEVLRRQSSLERNVMESLMKIQKNLEKRAGLEEKERQRHWQLPEEKWIQKKVPEEGRRRARRARKSTEGRPCVDLTGLDPAAASDTAMPPQAAPKSFDAAPWAQGSLPVPSPPENDEESLILHLHDPGEPSQ
mmetsp:Transcript_65487/g.156477  ORF Transcript_65487/g.156477 Transcript_65487/m.156477 type:complete len:859 (-) Transcript_65487:35-2611(-)